MTEVTRVLQELRDGREGARARLVDLVYEQLRVLARSSLRRRRQPPTLQPTELVHEAFLRLVGQEHVSWNDRTHFFAACAGVMRNILTDHARRRHSLKRGGNAQRITLLDPAAPQGAAPVDLVALDEALRELEALNARHARVVEYRFFSGMTVPEVAEALEVAPRTVESDWTMARAWLSARLAER